MKIAYRASNTIEAEIVRGMLQDYGIDAFTSGFYLQGGIGELAPTDLAHVLVLEDNYLEALKILQRYERHTEADSLEKESITCSPGQDSKVKLMGFVFVILLTLMVYSLGYFI